jgi:hypothetical protein
MAKINKIDIPVYYFTDKKTQKLKFDEVSTRKAFEDEIKKIKKEIK